MGEKKEMMASIISSVGIVVGIIGLNIITPTITTLTTASGALTASDFATAKTVVEFIPTFVALGILMSAIGGLVGPGVKIAKVATGGDLNIKESIVGIVAVVVGVIGISIFSPMISTLVGTGGALAAAQYATAKTIVTFIPVFFAITLLVGVISTITVAGKVGYNYARGS